MKYQAVYENYEGKSKTDLFNDIGRVAARLQNLGESFAATGNQMMYDTLLDEALHLNAITHTIKEIDEKEMSKSLETARAITGGLLKATLTGCIGGPSRELNDEDRKMINDIEKTPVTMKELTDQSATAFDL